VFISPVNTVRIGNLPFYAVPGEPYPSIKFSLNQNVGAPVSFIFGLAQDQLGYAEELADYNGALQCSSTDEWFFTISPVSAPTSSGCRRPTRTRSGSPSSAAARPPRTVRARCQPSTNCTQQQFEQSGLPAG